MKNNFSCGKRLRQLRTDRSLSQEELALAAGITPAYLGLIERETRNPTVKTIEKLCDAMDIALYDFFITEYDEGSDSDLNALSENVKVLMKGKSPEQQQIFLQIIKLAAKL